MNKLLGVVPFVVLLSVLLFQPDCKAQNPGLYGKKVSLSYNFLFMPALEGIPYNYSEKKEKGIHKFYRYRHQVELEVAVSRSLGIGAFYFQRKSGYGPRGSTLLSTIPTYNPYFSRNLEQRGFGVLFNLYKVKLKGYLTDEGALAPLGFYASPRLFVSFDDYSIVPNGAKQPIINYGTTHFGTALKIGRHDLLFNRVLLDIGIEIGAIIPSKFDFKEIEDTLEIFNETGITGVNTSRDPYSQLMFHHLFNIHIGIAYVLF